MLCIGPTQVECVAGAARTPGVKNGRAGTCLGLAQPCRCCCSGQVATPPSKPLGFGMLPPAGWCLVPFTTPHCNRAHPLAAPCPVRVLPLLSHSSEGGTTTPHLSTQGSTVAGSEGNAMSTATGTSTGTGASATGGSSAAGTAAPTTHTTPAVSKSMANLLGESTDDDSTAGEHGTADTPTHHVAISLAGADRRARSMPLPLSMPGDDAGSEEADEDADVTADQQTNAGNGGVPPSCDGWRGSDCTGTGTTATDGLALKLSSKGSGNTTDSSGAQRRNSAVRRGQSAPLETGSHRTNPGSHGTLYHVMTGKRPRTFQFQRPTLGDVRWLFGLPDSDDDDEGGYKGGRGPGLVRRSVAPWRDEDAFFGRCSTSVGQQLVPDRLQVSVGADVVRGGRYGLIGGREGRGHTRGVLPVA